ncbi:TPA: universal stress protein [Pseudomonas putida]|jgi:nucleotide-binding universal stress UspA family protein|uniref:UspA domain protein n=2 Tax=Pseudomonas putida TaxID=303 RepID=B0KGS0_PSEPG|nr:MULTISPECIES: universal stress protein [Pseudomonas]ABZ00466.1 UspA domain protein [Pseudomonas putida GB-1]APF00565.1 universal stress protein [Pseudomonas putida]MBP0708501.1 universal stress protein [Pseudomonas sp. T34]MCE0999632.1 universal stress protein [Pseudomonas sp. NMI1173_11]MCK2187939.1 universal stress protein [Pseudomonas sp. MB04B]
MPSSVLIAIDASPASSALLALARRYCRPGEHELHVLLAIDSTFAVHEQPAPYTTEELEEYPAACEEQQHADHAVTEAVRELQQAGFASRGCMVAGQPVDVIVTKAHELNCELIIMGHRHLSRLGRLLDPSISAKVIDQVKVPVLVGAAG